MIPFRNYILSTASALALMLLAACTDEATIAEDQAISLSDGVYAVMPQLKNVNVGNGPHSRSTLHFDYTTGVMKFNWENNANECIGVFGYQLTASSVRFDRELGEATGAGIYSKFKSHDPGISIQPSQNYISYRPYTIAKDLTDYKHVPVSFEGQTAIKNPLLPEYYKATYDNLTAEQKATCLANYEASEKQASSHLGAYDYLASGVVQANASGGITFTLYRLPAVTRFFIKCPAEEVFDSLQVIVQGKEFTLRGTMDMEQKTITATKTSTVQTLKFQGGFDMTNKATNANYYKNSSDEYVGYIVAYMMFAPVNLTNATSLYIYLFGHDSQNKKKYYRAKPSEKPDLTANKFYQWSTTNDSSPILFEAVDMQQWETDASYNNTNGNGTGAW